MAAISSVELTRLEDAIARSLGPGVELEQLQAEQDDVRFVGHRRQRVVVAENAVVEAQCRVTGRWTGQAIEGLGLQLSAPNGAPMFEVIAVG